VNKRKASYASRMELQHGAARGTYQRPIRLHSECFACFEDMFSTLLFQVNNISYFETVLGDGRQPPCSREFFSL
jgi:hypothetical protein